VAGGVNPRKKLLERLRNRFIKKFYFFPTLIGTFGCTGCGRCVEACLGNIDIRKVLRELTGAEVKE
jgi:ferredoxin